MPPPALGHRHVQYELTDGGHERVATVDIETTGYDPDQSELVAVGIGVHERGTPASAVDCRRFYRESPDDEAATIRAAVSALDELDADQLVSFNGDEFDLPYLQDRLTALGESPPAVALAEANAHVDLFVPRKVRAEARGEPWPGLEACLRSYDIQPATTVWQGEKVDNTLFGERLGPRYLDAVATGEPTRLREAIDHYLVSDLEANLALYYADIGAAFTPTHADDRAEF